MIKYEVRTVKVETRNGKNAIDAFDKKTNQDTYLVAACDTLEEARAAYDDEYSGVRHSSHGGLPLFEHFCKMIEINEYDEDGEWVSGGDWYASDFPDYPGAYAEVTEEEASDD